MIWGGRVKNKHGAVVWERLPGLMAASPHVLIFISSHKSVAGTRRLWLPAFNYLDFKKPGCVCVCVKWMFFNLLFLLYWPSQALGISTCHSCTESSFALFFKLFVLVCVCVCVSQSICRWHEGVQAGLMTANSWTWLTGFQNQKISGGGG